MLAPLNNLEFIYLRSTDLGGPLTCSLVAGKTNLKVLDISDTQASGELPVCFVTVRRGRWGWMEGGWLCAPGAASLALPLPVAAVRSSSTTAPHSGRIRPTLALAPILPSRALSPRLPCLTSPVSHPSPPTKQHPTLEELHMTRTLLSGPCPDKVPAGSHLRIIYAWNVDPNTGRVWQDGGFTGAPRCGGRVPWRGGGRRGGLGPHH